MSSTEAPLQPAKVKVTLLLQGGHEYTIELQPQDPLLQQLVSAVISRSQANAGHQPGYFQIPVDQGQSSLIVGCQDVIGVVTQPPVMIQTAPPEISTPEQSPPQVSQRSLGPQHTTASAIIPSPVIQLHEVLSAQEVTKLLDYVFTREFKFVPTQTSTQDPNYRQSFILYDFPKFATLMQQRVTDLLPEVLQQLDRPLFNPSQIEVQLTAHNDGNYYKVHNDNGSPDTANRELTYVYYFYQMPKAFTGGELRLYDSRIEGSYAVQANSFTAIDPIHNSIVFFPSGCLHEVLPVKCPSLEFTHSRFTINGWVRR